jgi:hypothetical protein
MMDLVAADPSNGSQLVLAHVMVADPTRSTSVMVTAVSGHGVARLAADMKAM